MNAVTLRLARPYSILIVHRRFGEHRQGLGLFESNRPDFLHRSLSGDESLAEPREPRRHRICPVRERAGTRPKPGLEGRGKVARESGKLQRTPRVGGQRDRNRDSIRPPPPLTLAVAPEQVEGLQHGKDSPEP